MTTTALIDGRRRRSPQAHAIDPALVDLLADQAPLTVVRAPTGYGKTILLDTWLEEDPPAGQVVRLALTPQCDDVEHFWYLLDTALAGVSSAAREPGRSARTRVLRRLAHQETPLTLVIDDYHRAAGSGPDEDLLELVRHNDRLCLVIATRSTRPIETTGSLAVDVNLVCPHRLGLRPDQVRVLAEGLGVDLVEGEAERLVTGFAGWPAVIRSVLTRLGTAGGTVSPEVADDYIVNVWRDLRDPGLQSFLLCTAVPDSFDAELAEALAPAEHALSLLHAMRSSGLLEERLHGGRYIYSYPPLVREALVRAFAETRPAELRGVHARVMELARRRGDVVQALFHAVAAGEYATAELLMENGWHDLVTIHREALVRAARAIPADVAERRPRFRIAKEDLDAAPADVRPPHQRWHAGDLRGVTAEFAPSRAGTDETTFALLQWGTAAVLTGDWSAALYAFGRARTLAQQVDERSSVVAIATLGLAGAHATAGDVDLAAAWLRDGVLERSDDPPAVAGVIEAWGATIRTLVALDQLAPDDESGVGAVVERSRRDEVWALGVLVTASHAVTVGGPVEAVRQAAQLRAARHYVPRGRFTEASLHAGEVDVLLTGGLLEQAREVARDLPVTAVSLDSHARIALAGGAFRDAAQRARSGLGHPGLSRRVSMKLRLVLAAAHHALGEQAAAGAAFMEAVRIAQASGQRRPLLVMDHAVFTALAGGDERVLALWPEAHRPAERVARAEVAGLLTPRELEVLRVLRQHSGAVPVAEALGLSVNTVKSHLRSVYAKLGVASRSAALRRAAELEGSNLITAREG
ncbi:hypothetical protein GCM10023169_06800 [Georgenia halophila]|uniref:HTH luxR-type domain-containing protein n=1 Tax=Georgenia halophila TaxID=620889 RepID=A0ABP8KX00_9MICO